ncbi:MAG: type IV pilus assembly protein PilM [Bacillota bacterium]
MNGHNWKSGPIGLDLGAHTFKAVQLMEAGGNISLGAVATVRAPIFGEGPLKINEMSRAISRLLQLGSFSKKEVMVAASNEDCVVRILYLPKIPSSEIEQAVHWEMEKFVPFGANDYVTQHRVIKEVEADGTKLETLVVAARKSPIVTVLDSLSQSRLTSLGVDMEALAAGRVIAGASDEAFCLLDIGHSHTAISLFEGPYLRIHRSINMAGFHLMDRIDRALGTGTAEFQQVMSEAMHRKEVVAEAIEPILSEICVEINRSLNYFRSQLRRDIDGVYLTGGGAAIVGVQDFIEMNVVGDIQRANPLSEIRVDEANIANEALDVLAPRLAVAVGLAMRGLKQA